MAMVFDDDTYKFLEELAENNNREWFHENKQRYESYVVEPALTFIQNFEPILAERLPHFQAVAKKVGGSLFRIYRDTRFSKVKTPYKTHIGIHFRHEASKSAHAPGFYVHIQPQGCFLGGGIWRPAGDDLLNIRQHLTESLTRYEKIVSDPAFSKLYTLSGESLTRPPKGFDKESPAIEHVKRKDFIAIHHFSDRQAKGKGLQKYSSEALDTAKPLLKFLCDALSLPC